MLANLRRRASLIHLVGIRVGPLRVAVIFGRPRSIRRQPMTPDLVIFDCDGVLVDSEPIINRVFVEMMAELGFELDYEDTLREFSGVLCPPAFRSCSSG